MKSQLNGIYEFEWVICLLFKHQPTLKCVLIKSVFLFILFFFLNTELMVTAVSADVARWLTGGRHLVFEVS